MLHAVIVAHPRPNSLNHAIARTYRESVAKLGHATLLRDLYDLKADPCLKAPDTHVPIVMLGRDLTRTPDHELGRWLDPLPPA